MTWLDNPIAQMWGPSVLVPCAVVMAILLALSLWLRRYIDESMRLGDLPIPSRIDPYQFAYLRGGIAEVLRLATVDLYQRGLIVDFKPDSPSGKQLHLVPKANLADVDPSLRAVADFYRTPRQPTDLLRSGRKVGFEEKITRWDRWIESEQLYHSTDAQTYHSVSQFVLLVVYLLLGNYILVSTDPMTTALLVMCGVMTIGAVILVGTIMQLPRFTKRGRRFIDNVQTAFVILKRPQSVTLTSSDASQPAEKTEDAVPILAMGLFGVTALQGGPLDMLFEQYAKSTEAGSACGVGCGSGDGGGGCGGGGCGCGGE